MTNPGVDWTQLLYIFLALAGIALVLVLVLLGWVLWKVRKIKLPVDADPLTALRLTPFAVVLLLDMLDLSLDFLSAPLAWVLLGYLGLKPLRGATVIQAVLPGTQFLPTMTVAWIVARLTDPRRRGRRA
jgi:hypothetical protein